MVRTFLTINDVCMRRFACKAWYTLSVEYDANVLGTTTCQKTMHAEYATW